MYDMILIIFFRLLIVNNISYVLLDFSVGSTYAHAVSKGLAKEKEKRLFVIFTRKPIK